MRHKLWITACILAALLAAFPIFGKSSKVSICHRTGKGVNLIEVSPQARDAHLLHGDYDPYEIVIDEFPVVPYC